jgi:hypothetical protein
MLRSARAADDLRVVRLSRGGADGSHYVSGQSHARRGISSPARAALTLAREANAELRTDLVEHLHDPYCFVQR